jgi:triacylglycerol lipase
LARVKFISIWTPLDLTVLPAKSSRILAGEALTIVSPFHGTLLFDPRILRMIADALRQPVAAEMASMNLQDRRAGDE